jgi:hypothetical protein
MVTSASVLEVSVGAQVALQSTPSGGTLVQTRVAATVASASGRSFGAAVAIDLSQAGAAPSRTLQDLQSAIALLKQADEQSRDVQKRAAAQQLALAVKELALLKLLGNGLSGAREAVRLARRIAAAVQDYAAAGCGGAVASVASLAAADPFYATASAALSQLRTYLGDVLPALQASPDRKTRRAAGTLQQDFQAADATISAAVESAGLPAPAAAPVSLVA